MTRTALTLLTCLWLAVPLHASEFTLTLDDGTDLPVSRYQGDGQRLLVWLPSNHGVLPGHHQQAEYLQAQGVEVWLPDPYAAYFLPNTPSSLDRIPEDLVGRLIDHAREETGKQVYVFGNDRAAPWVLTSLRAWQMEEPRREGLGGVILMSPYLHTGIPEDDRPPEFQPVTRATNLPVYLIQPVLSPQYPLLMPVVDQLGEGGSHVYVRTLPRLRDRFFFRPNTLDAEEAFKPELATELVTAMRMLDGLESRRVAVDIEGAARTATPTRQDRRLEPWRGNPEAPPLELPDLAGTLHDLAGYRGDVVLINFWASWCPPCVHEMPSMQRLEDALGDGPFRILAVNLGEDEDTVVEFLERIQVDFTILMDPDNSALRHWNVLAYPTSFVIDRAGEIRYALFGAIEWMEPEVIKVFEDLMAE
ncbi:alkyl hydroperoxide reductase [Thioalkalivibrio denitrificans]|uniref:Alkyl hydroperoxide reductase n=1 Tax=Thioalkalivibrio denitrificans TaxID=108003 RepID=A0A1V3NPU1_9GAMM|nr:TlpA disulfide reductase family protein [Thioalkalivibrio denitrificans]OOG27115.1 alkyl hydroperoxide reductase [Thioalkalivibrio denitrificans]